jgi:cyclopropane fatty-acyl-phospholipid synthase-like methyltransferase
MALACAIVAVAATAGVARQAAPRQPDVRYVPSPQDVVDAMLTLAGVTRDDVVYDLGSGDGRIPITAAKVYGARAVGIDIDPDLIAEATENAKAAGVAGRVRFIQQDLFAANISDATVVTLYLLSTLNVKLLPKLNRELRPGARVVTHAFDMGGIRPRRTVDVGGRAVHLFTVPIR